MFGLFKGEQFLSDDFSWPGVNWHMDCRRWVVGLCKAS